MAEAAAGERTGLLIDTGCSVSYAPSPDPRTGYLFFIRGGDLMVQPFDNARLEMRGEPVRLAEQIVTGGGYANFSASTPALVYRSRRTNNSRLTWYDRTGKATESVGEPDSSFGVSLSPDGSRVARSRNDGSATSIWLLNLTPGSTDTQFTFDPARDFAPVWAADGKHLVYSHHVSNGVFSLKQKAASGDAKEEVLLTTSAGSVEPQAWSPDGHFLVYSSTTPETRSDLWVLPLNGDRKPFSFLCSPYAELQARLSPDGRWIAYVSDASGQLEVYVRPFNPSPDTSLSCGTPDSVNKGARWLVSRGGGTQPRWSPNGKEILYVGPTHLTARRRQHRIRIPGCRASAAVRSEKHRGRLHRNRRRTQLGCYSRRKAFSHHAEIEGGTTVPITVVLNWMEALKK